MSYYTEVQNLPACARTRPVGEILKKCSSLVGNIVQFSKPYLVVKLVSPGLVLSNRLRKVQLGRLPEPTNNK